MDLTIRHDKSALSILVPTKTKLRRSKLWHGQKILENEWADGKSASQIAVILGEGVSRNAVIGKVHRLGLSGREKPSKPGSIRSKTTTRLSFNWTPEKDAILEKDWPKTFLTQAEVASRIGTTITTAKNRAKKLGIKRINQRGSGSLPRVSTEPVPKLPPADVHVLANGDFVTILTLNTGMCKMSRGMSEDGEHYFCGNQTVNTDEPYCPSCSQATYQGRRRRDGGYGPKPQSRTRGRPPSDTGFEKQLTIMDLAGLSDERFGQKVALLEDA